MFGIADYLDVIDYILTRTQALLEILPEDDRDAVEMTTMHIAVLKDLKIQLEAGTPSRLLVVH